VGDRRRITVTIDRLVVQGGLALSERNNFVRALKASLAAALDAQGIPPGTGPIASTSLTTRAKGYGSLRPQGLGRSVGQAVHSALVRHLAGRVRGR
jgi:hypothetical protein